MSARPTLICPAFGQTHDETEFSGDTLDLAGGFNRGVHSAATEPLFRQWWFNAKELSLEATRTTTFDATVWTGTATFSRSSIYTASTWAQDYPDPSILADAAFGLYLELLDRVATTSWDQTGGSATYDDGSGGGPVAASMAAAVAVPQLMARPKDDDYRYNLFRQNTSFASGGGLTLLVNGRASATSSEFVASESYSLTGTEFQFTHETTSGVIHDITTTITDTFF